MEDIMKNYFLQSVAEKLNEGMKKRNREMETIMESQSPYLAEARIESLRSRLLKIIGFDFEKCDLMPVIADAIDMGEYVIEKILIQSLPGYYVPMHAYKPAAAVQRRYPAVLVPMGHYIEGKNLRENQIFCANLARQGYIALTFDPIFQGERDLFPEKAERHAEKDKWVVAQHMMGALQGYLLGEQITKYYLWDGIRALDYLCAREDVDESSIGCCGQSGGGMQTAYLSAIDPRIKVAVPIQYITSVEEDLRINGVGDAEQATYGLMKERIDKSDLLWMIAPRPLLINASLKDIFPLEGTVKTAGELKRLYGVLGAVDRVKLVEIDTEHCLAKETREACYSWLNRWLKKEMDFKPETDIVILSDDRLDCGYGQCGSLDVLDMNRSALEEAIKQRHPASGKPGKMDLLSMLKNFFSTIYRDEYTVHRLDECKTYAGTIKETFQICTGNNHEAFCELSMKQGNAKLMVLLDMKNIFGEDQINSFGRSGYDVLRIKPFGSCYTTGKDRFFYDDQSIVTHCLFADAKDMVSVRANEVLCCLDFIRNIKQLKTPLVMIGTGQGAIVSLISSLYEEGIEKLFTAGMLASFKSLFEHKEYFINESDVICGFLKNHDISDLVSASLAKSIILINPVDGQEKCCSAACVEKEYNAVRNNGNDLKIIVTDNILKELSCELHLEA